MVKRGVGLSPEERHVFPKLTVEENLNMGAYIRKDKNGIKSEIERVYGLFPRLKERSKQLAASYQMAIYGLIIILTISYFPEGLFPFLKMKLRSLGR